jgi:hypothetical protein
MNPAIDGFHVVVRQLDLARSDAPMKVSEFGRVLTLIYGLAPRTEQEEDHGVKDVDDLLHEEESGELVLIRRLSKIFLKINPFLCVIGDDQIRNDGQVGIPIVQESSFPVHQPNAVSVEKDIVRLEQVVVTRHHVGIVLRVNRRQLRIPGEKFLPFAFGENGGRLEPPDEFLRGSLFVH